jgi:hypothetical protein
MIQDSESLDLYLRRMGDEMALQRGVEDYNPTALKDEEQRTGRRRRQPWLGGEPSLPPRCELSARPASCRPGAPEVTHQLRRRRSSALNPPVR